MAKNKKESEELKDNVIPLSREDGASNENSRASDPFADLTSLRMSQDFAEKIGVEKLITKVAVRKPDAQWWVRTNQSPDYRFETAVLELKDRSELYLVARPLWTPLADEIRRVVIFTTITRQGVIFFWPIKLPDADGKHNEWHRSALTAALIAENSWVRVSANRQGQGYDVTKSKADLDEPNWPNVTFQELMRIAFKDRYIDSMDHPVLKELRGEV